MTARAVELELKNTNRIQEIQQLERTLRDIRSNISRIVREVREKEQLTWRDEARNSFSGVDRVLHRLELLKWDKLCLEAAIECKIEEDTRLNAEGIQQEAS